MTDNLYRPPNSNLSPDSENVAADRLKGMILLTSAPPLVTFNGIGVHLYGRSNLDPETGAYIATYYFTVLFVPFLPLSRYYVVEVDKGQYQFIASLPLRILDKIHLALGVFSLAGIALYLAHS